MFIFDGPNLQIHIDLASVVDATVTFTPEELWSRWVDWTLIGDNSKYLPALRITGGDPIGGGQYIGNYLFLRNDLGWRGIPPEVDGATVIINGAFFGEDPTLPVMFNNVGQETKLIINRSSMVTNTASGGGSTDLSAVLSQLNAIQTSMATKGDVYAAKFI
jgi:hypothetical protein